MCNHKKTITRWGETNRWDDETEQYIMGWIPDVVETFVDINIHQFKCTQCNKVFNYTGGGPRPWDDDDEDE